MLKYIRAGGGLSRVELSRKLDIAPSTIGIYVDRLINEGFLVETKRTAHKYGRRPMALLPNPNAGHFVGVDLEARNILAVVIDFSNNNLKQLHRPISKGKPLEKILICIEEIVSSAIEADRRPLLGIGVGVPGTVDLEKGLASEYDFIPNWKQVPLAERLAQKFGVPVYLENNIRSMAMAELWFGQGIGLQNFICIGARTGVGIGAVVNGQLLQGAHGAGGSIGKWLLPKIARPWCNGRTGVTLESIASLRAILEACAATTRRKMDFSALQVAIAANEYAAMKIVSQAAEIHGWAIHQLNLLFDPERIIVVGPLAELGSSFVEPLANMIHELSQGDMPQIVSSNFGQYGGAFGTAALALQHWKPIRKQLSV
jgi:glucokinase